MDGEARSEEVSAVSNGTTNTSGTGPTPATPSNGEPVRFFHRRGHANVRPDLEALIASATRSLRAAVCFFTKAGYVLLSRHARQLNLPGSYFVASVDFPTDLRALQALHRSAPGHVYIHLGGKTPEEPQVGRSLMHSKVFLAVDDDQQARLWVGSHNLTAMAVEGGNIEAGITFTGPTVTAAVQDAAEHLEACRTMAELFDPDDMERYKEIQRRRRRESEWDLERYVVVVHAETSDQPTQPTMVVHLRIEPTDFDRYFRVDRRVRLFLHPLGSLKVGMPVDYQRASLWTGEITAVVRAELHPKNRGAAGQFAGADYEVDLPGPNGVPVFLLAGQSRVLARTQVVVRVTGRGEPGEELYSQGAESPVVNVLDAPGILELHEADHDMLGCFTPESLIEQRLLYRPAVGVKQELHVKGYEETMHSTLPEKFHDAGMPDAGARIHYVSEAAERPLDPFIFLSTYVVRPKRPQ